MSTPDVLGAPIPQEEIEKELDWLRYDEFGGSTPCALFVEAEDDSWYCRDCGCSEHSHEWMRRWTAIRDRLLVLTRTLEERTQERDELRQRIARQALTIQEKRDAWWTERLRADAAEQERDALLAALHGVQTEDGCYCATGHGNPHSAACLQAQRAVMAVESK